MTPREFLAAAQGVLEDVGRVLLEVTAVLVLSYLIFFVGSLVVAALRHAARRVRHGRRATEPPDLRAPGATPAVGSRTSAARSDSMAAAGPGR